MPNIFTDVATALKLTGEVRKARKSGADAVKVQPIWEIPVLRTGYWGFTGEACILYGKESKAIVEVFETFPEEVQHRLTFAPKDGEWGDRIPSLPGDGLKYPPPPRQVDRINAPFSRSTATRL